MLRKFLAPALAGLLLTTAAYAGPDSKVGEIVVTMDLAAVTNAAAAKRYANVAVDLKNALAVRLADRVEEGGMKIKVDLSEVELSNSYSEVSGAADTKLVGQVIILDKKANSSAGGYELTVNVDQAKVFYPEGVVVTTLSVSSDVFYKAMIEAFADSVVRRIDG